MSVPDLAVPALAQPIVRYRALRALVVQPAAMFLLLATLLGIAVIAITPPLRGPDEAAHFLRAYAISGGEIIPSQADEHGRKGVRLPARMYLDFDFFDTAKVAIPKNETSFPETIAKYPTRPAARPESAGGPPVFILYSGSEGYAPFPYLPYVAAALVARLLDLDLAWTLYLMRLVGFVTVTAATAYAIALTPHLKWAFLCIAMLP